MSMPDPIGEEDDFIVKSKPETKQMSFIHICALTAMYKQHQHVMHPSNLLSSQALGVCVQVFK